ncbi:MAG: EF-hand domain-containing protein [Steroidobacteraceae bacterium]
MKAHKLRNHTLAVAVGSLVLVFGASAGDDKMQMMDTDKDGKISASEHAAGAKQKFQKMDSDGDGRVTTAEMDAAHKSIEGGGKPSMSSADMIKTIDTNNDGAITAAEHEKSSRDKFAKMDANGDGSLTSEELHAEHK